MKNLYILMFSLILLSCAEKEDTSVFLPFSEESQACITSFLATGNLNFKIIYGAFEIEFPEKYLGVIKITPDKNRDMKAVYDTIKYDCYPNLKVTTRLANDDWASLSNDINVITQGISPVVSKYKNIYIKVDVSKKSYSIFQRQDK